MLRRKHRKIYKFLVQLKKNLIILIVTYKSNFIDSFRFMSSSLSNLVDNLSERVRSNKCTDCKSCLDNMLFKDDQLISKYPKCSKDHNNNFNKDLVNRFASTYEFYDKQINKFILLFKKGVYRYEYMDSWERYDEKLLPDKEYFYSSLNMEGIRDVDYRHEKKVFKEFEINNLGDYHNLYVQSNTLLLADVFKNFRNKCIEMHGLDPAQFLSAPGLA